MRHPCVSSRVRAPLPRLDYAVVSVWGQVRIPLSRPVALVPEQIPDVHQRHPVHNQPARSGVPHYLRREPAHPGFADGGIPDPIPEVPLIDWSSAGPARIRTAVASRAWRRATPPTLPPYGANGQHREPERVPFGRCVPSGRRTIRQDSAERTRRRPPGAGGRRPARADPGSQLLGVRPPVGGARRESRGVPGSNPAQHFRRTERLAVAFVVTKLSPSVVTCRTTGILHEGVANQAPQRRPD